MTQRGSGRSTPNRLTLFVTSVVFCGILIGVSASGVLGPIEGLVATPLNWLSSAFTRLGVAINGGFEDVQGYEELQEYVGELEVAFAQVQTEVVGLREIASDYERLARLVDYAGTRSNEEVLAADVISRETVSALRTILINRGSRDNVRKGMPVVTENGLVGRVIGVQANAARVLLVNSEASFISGRLQLSRVEGTVNGLPGGTMRMSMLEQNAQITVGDLVLTSGLGGNLPPDHVIGQVTSIRQFESSVEQTAEIRSLIDFDRLEIVLVITSFEPVDLSIFESEATPSP